MITFDEPNLSGDWKCPICSTSEVKPVILAGIDGTRDGNNIQAIQVHLDCIDLTYFEQPMYDAGKALVMFFEGETECA